MTSTILMQCSTNWANKPTGSWSLYWFLLNLWSNESMTVNSVQFKKWIFASNLHINEYCQSSNENKAWKKFRPVWDLNPWPLWCPCMAFCSLSLCPGSWESSKPWNKHLTFKLALLILMVSRNAFHSTNLFLFFFLQVPNPQFLHSFWWRTKTWNVSSETLYISQFTLSTQLIILNYLEPHLN